MSDEIRLREDIPVCPVCGQPMDSDQDSKGTVEINGKRICVKCGLKALGMDEDTELFVPYDEDEVSEDEESEEDTEDEDDSEEYADDDEDSVDDEQSEDVPEEDEESEDDDTIEESEETVTESPESEEKASDGVGDQEDKESVSETDSDNVADKLIDETHDEIHQDVSWFKKKTKEKIVDDPDSFRERWRRARLMRHGHVILRTLSRDPDTGDVICESTLVRLEDLPSAAVQCTNEKGIYALDTIKTSVWYQKTRENLGFNEYEAQFTASDAALYMMSNKIDNALITKWTDFSHMDMKKIFIGVGLAVMVLVYLIVKAL